MLCKTRLHWVAVLMPTPVGLFMAIFAIICFFQASRGGQDPGQDSRVWSIAGIVLLALGAVTEVCAALVRRNATEMAVTNRRILVNRAFCRAGRLRCYFLESKVSWLRNRFWAESWVTARSSFAAPAALRSPSR